MARKFKELQIDAMENTEILEFGQLFANLNDENDIHVNGSVSIDNGYLMRNEKIRIHANLCDKVGRILHVLNDYGSYDIKENTYFAFSMYCSDITRYFDVADLYCVDVYAVFVRPEEQ